MNIVVKVVGQKLEVATNLKNLVAGTQQFIRFIFKLPSDWDGLTVHAQFIQNDEVVNAYQDELNREDNSIYLPPEIHPGNCIIVLYGEDNGDVRAVTDYLSINLTKNMIVADPRQIRMTDTVYSMIIKAITGEQLTADQVRAIINADVANIMQQYLDDGVFADIIIEDGSITRAKVDANFETTLAKADSAIQPGDSNSITRGMVDSEIEGIFNRVENWEVNIEDGSISRSKVDANFEATLQRADNAITPSDARIITSNMLVQPLENLIRKADTSLQDVDGGVSKTNLAQDVQDDLALAHSAMQGINPGSISRAMLDSNLNAAIVKAENASQTIVVNSLPSSPVNGADYILDNDGVYMYYKYIDDEWQLIAGSQSVIGDELPDEDGKPSTDYYVLNEMGTYTHYRWIDGEYKQVGGASTTMVITSLDEPGIESVDYIYVHNGEYSYYKYLDGEWRMISGASGEVITYEHAMDYFKTGTPAENGYVAIDHLNKYYLDMNTLTVYYSEEVDGEEVTEPIVWTPTALVAEPSDKKSYYVQFGTNTNFLLFRYQGNKFYQVGSVTYTKEEIDAMLNTLNNRITVVDGKADGHEDRITNNENNIISLGNALGNLQQTVADLDTEGYTYYATYGTAEISGSEVDNVYALHQVKDQQDEIVSQFVITGGDGGGQAAVTNLVVEKVTASPLILTTNDRVIIEIDYSSTDDDGETYDATYVWKLDNRIITSGQIVTQGRVSFDLTDYCQIGTQKLSLTVTDEAGSIALKSWTVQKVDVRIDSSFSDRYTFEIGRNVSFTYTPYGAINKTIHFKLDGVEDTYQTSASGTLQSYQIPAQEHGSHLLEAWITAIVNNVPVESNHIYKDIIWYDPTQGGEAVIGCIYRNDYYGKMSVRQYDTAQITYNVYDPSTNYPTVRRYVDGELVGTDNVQTPENIWNFQSDEIGDHELKIVVRNTTVVIIVTVTELGIDVEPITGGLEIDFNPTGITNASQDRIWHNDNYNMTVSDNFDWANGGYKIDENGDTYFLIKAGTTASFDYLMFDGGVERNPSVLGTEMKVIFMTENVQDANAVWLSNVETTTTESIVDGQTVTTTTNMGIQMGVHNGWLKTNKASDTDINGETSADSIAATNTYLYMPYSEEDIIEMDINIDTIDRDDETAHAFVMAYEDGVPAKAYVYDNSDRFYQYSPKPLVFGSSYCDVRIYRLKIYSASLTTEGIMRNFIADSRNSTTMLKRYDRNSIYYNRDTGKYTPYSGEGVLEPERLATVIPNVKVLMLETDHFTTSKKTFVKSSLRCIHAPGGNIYEGDPYYDNWLFENGWHSGQGTTSDNYGNSGRNVDFLFNCDGVHKPSDKIKDPEPDYISQVTLGYNTENAHTEKVTDWKGDTGKVALTRTSVPNNFFNLKVNIASSENANNALMQKRYNDFLPYISPGYRRDNRIKNDMEFVPAVLFLKETNPDVSTHNEFLDNEWHFYALGNLGDSKKTDYTRSYDPTDMNEFTIEISDNTKNNATFQTGVYLKQDGTYGYETFHLIKTLDKEGELVVTPVSEVSISEHISPVPYDQIDELLFAQGTIHVINETGLAEHDGDEYGYLNMRMWCLYNEGFDGDHSFEPRYACCGDYRDGKLVNDYSGYGKKQVKTNEKVWRAFYKWVISSTNEQFVQELDQWCVRSAVEFFYAFTLYYTMMDNRAKNTFWHFAKTGNYRAVSRPVDELLHIYCELVDGEYVPTEDTEIDPEKTYYTQYAFDLWCYDTDTGLGINNNGELVFPYGKEDDDFNIDGNPSSGYVFNGATSVFWCRLRDLLSNEITETFNSVSAECFSATNLINQFDRFQGCYPEEVWRLDVERKYIRTYTGKSMDNSIPKHDTQYLRDMMQGRKKYQRRQWVKDQEIYFGTKYLMNTVVGDNNRITFRCYDPGNDVAVPKNYSLSITPFQDMYVSAMFGNGDQRQVRAKAGETVVLNFNVSTTTDTQVTIYGANRIAALNDLSACYIAANNFSMATKLRKLVIGNTTPGYNNSRLVSLTLGTNKLLEELDIRNCGSLTGAINLAQCSNLLRFYADGSKITGATFATNGKIETIHLPSTINTLTMRNLNNLSDFQASLDYLETLTLQGGTLNNMEIVNDTVDTLQTANLYDIDWILPDSSLLNELYDLFSSQLTGSVYVNGTIRIREVEKYNAKWSDLEVTYNPADVVEQYPVTFVNYDGTELYVEYVDRGSAPLDPIEQGYIDIPTKPSDSEYTYTYSGWDDLEAVVLAPRTITAQYSQAIRTYTVNWYSRAGVLLYTAQTVYGTEAVYGGPWPTRTDGEASYHYYIFTGWDKSTGYITGDLDVYAIWQDAYTPITYASDGAYLTKELNEMTYAELYALGHSDSINFANIKNLEAKDYKDFTVGNDFAFTNVRSQLLLENEWFDGTRYEGTNITLFDENADSFTMAIDFEYFGTTFNSTLVSCFVNSGSEGFRLRYSNGASIQWGDKNAAVAPGTSRGIVALRHVKGSSTLWVYAFNPYDSTTYDDDITKYELVRTRVTNTSMTLGFGAVKYPDGGFDSYATGWIHWAKIWYDDLGDTNASKLASWPHETWRAEYIDSQSRYHLDIDGTSKYAKMAFILNNLLSQEYVMNRSDTNVGGWGQSSMRDFLNGRVYNSLPDGFKSILCRVAVGSSVGGGSNEVVTSGNYLFIPSLTEMNNSQYLPYIEEGKHIGWFNSSDTRVKFAGLALPDDHNTYQSSTTDPSSITSNNVKYGDIWFNSSSWAYFMYVPQEIASKHTFANISSYYDTIIPAADGGTWVTAQQYGTRSPMSSNDNQFCSIATNGNYSNMQAYSSVSICLCFAI